MIIAYAISLSGMFLLIDGYLGTCHVTAQSPVASLSAATKKHATIGDDRQVLDTKKINQGQCGIYYTVTES